MFIYYIRRPPDLLEATKMVKMAAWARTGIWCHTVNMNFIYIYRLWSFHGSLFDQVETGISVCVCATVYECHQLALEQNPWPYLGNWSVSVRIPQILS